MLLDFSEQEGRERLERELEEREREAGVVGLGAWGSYHGVSASAGRQLLNAAAAGCSLPLVFAFMVPVFGKRRKAAFLSHPNAASMLLIYLLTPFHPLTINFTHISSES
jgi:hypothetical protein